MAPAQTSSDVDPTTKASSNTKAVPRKDTRISTNPNQNALRCTSNFEDTMFEMEALLNEHTKAPDSPKDTEIDVVEQTTGSDSKSVKVEDPDETEYSSSFGGTVSGAGNYSGLSEVEVESEFCLDNDWAPPFDVFNTMFQMRKKKLTNHWRNFIRPLMWRCKWMELKIKEVESQALKYTTELAAYDQRKNFNTDQYLLEGGGSKSLPFSNEHYKNKAMKRRKRKRVEDITDLTSYMLNHNIFSYLEKKKSDPDCTSIADDFGNPVVTEQNANVNAKFGISDDQSIFEFRDTDNSLEMILSKIEIVHSRVQKLKDQLEMVMSKNIGMFSSSENLSLLAPCDPQTSSAHSPTFSAGNRDAISVAAICSQPMSECDIGDPFMPESAVSSYGEVFNAPDIIESTMGLLSAVDVTLHQPQIGDSCEDILDNVFRHDEPAEGGRHNFGNMSNLTIDKNQEPGTTDQEESTTLASAEKPDALASEVMPQQLPTLKSCLTSELHFPKNKRRQVERKAGSGAWNRKPPDS